MRALFFLLDGETNASSYHRVLQYLPYLRAHGVDPWVSQPVPEPLYQRLIEGDRPGVLARATFYAAFVLQRFVDVLRSDRFDVVVIQRDLFPFGPPVLERLLAKRNTRLVYDTDDATYLRPAFTSRTPFQRLRRFDKVADVVGQARWISAATEPIAEWARHFNPNVSVVPMAVDLAHYDRIRRPPSTDNARVVAGKPRSGHDTHLVVGWAGTAGGIAYLEALAPVLRDLARGHPFVLRVISGGYRRVCLPGVPLDARPWRAATALQDIAQFDVGLVPLANTAFEQAKFPFKLLQYLASGVPAVSASVGTAASLIRHGENGLLAASDAEWRNALESLLSDADLRRRLAATGRETVAATYSVDRVAPQLLEGLRRVADSR